MTHEFIDITAVTNPFSPFDSRIQKQLAYTHGASISTYLGDMLNVERDDWDVAVSVNGKVLADDELPTYFLRPNDNIVFCLRPRGGDNGKNTWAIVAMVALTIAAPYAGAAMGGTMASALSITSPTAISVLGHMATAAIVIGGGYLLSTIFPSPKPDKDDSSPTYGWGTHTNTITEGRAWPILYGSARVKPYLISRHITVKEDEQYLNMLFAVADHAVDFIGNEKINDNWRSAYKGIISDKRYGAYDQEAIGYFNNSSMEKPVNFHLDKSLTTRPPFYTETSGNLVEELAIGITIPSGVFRVNDEGKKKTNTIYLSIWYKKEGGDWQTYEWEDTYWDQDLQEDIEYTASAIEIFGKKSSTVRKQYVISDLEPGRYSVSVGFCTIPDTDDQHFGHDVYWEYLQETIYQAFTYPGVSLLGMRALSTDQLSGGLPTISCRVVRNYVYIYNPYTKNWSEKPARNPAWICYDMLVNDFYGGAIAKERILYSEFEEWALFCEENEFLLSIYFDTASDFPKQMAKVETVGRGKVVQKGTNFGVIIDKADTPVQLFGEGNIIQGSFRETFLSRQERSTVIDVSYFDYEDDAAQKIITVFGDGYDPTAPEIKSQITLYGEVTTGLAQQYAKFLLACNERLLRTIEFEVDVDAIACQAGDVVNIASDIPQWGFSGRVISAGVDTITVDRDLTVESGVEYAVMVRHNHDDSLESKSFSYASSLQFNKLPAWADGQNYHIGDDVSYGGISYECTAEHISTELNRPGLGTGEWVQLNYIIIDTLALVSSWANVPAKDAVFSFGEVNKVVKPIKVLAITRTQEFRRRISGIEYDESVYSGSTANYTMPEYSSLALVTGLIAKEVWEVSGGSGVSAVHLSWRGVSLYWTVYYRLQDKPGWIRLALVTKPHYVVYNLTAETNYIFAVSYNDNPEDGVSTAFAFSGDPEIPTIPVPPVPNLEICGQGLDTIWRSPDLPLCWTAVSTFWANTAGDAPSGTGTSAAQTSYWLRIYNASDSSLRREQLLYDNKFIYSYGMNFADGNGVASSGLIVRVWTVDQYGNESATYAEITVSNPAPVAVSGLASAPFMHACRFTWDMNIEPDFSHFKYRFQIGSSAWENWQTTYSTFVLRTLSEAEVITHGAETLITIEIIAVDTFGNESTSQTTSCTSEGLNIAPTDIADFSVTASKMFWKVPVLEGELWAGNSVDTVSWNAHSLFYRGVEFQIAAGSTNKKYIYWDNPVTDWSTPPASPVVSSYSGRDTHPGDDGILTEYDFIMCVNLSGSYAPAWNSIANQVIGSAYIMNGAINNAHINDLSAAKITTGQLTAAVGNNYFDIATGMLHLESVSGEKALEWNPATGEIILYGVMHQSLSGVNFPLPTYRGGYSASLPYYKGDVVTHGGQTWMYINNTSTIGNEPAVGIYWQIFAAKGAQGEQGAAGTDGNDGVGAIYRGPFTPGATYYNNTRRKDLVKYNDHFYIYVGSDGLINTIWVTDRWESFGAEFSSVATDILLAQDANIDKRLVLGNQHITIDGVDNEIVVAGDGGKTGNDYALLKQGDLSFWHWDPASSEHYRYNAVRHVELGIGAPNGIQVEIPGFFKNQPRIMISPHTIKTFQAGASAQDQRLEVNAADITSFGANNTQWRFTPRVQLITDANGTGPWAINDSFEGSADKNDTPAILDSAQYPTPNLPPNVRTVRVSGRSKAFFSWEETLAVPWDIDLIIYRDGGWVVGNTVHFQPQNESCTEWFGFDLTATATSDIEWFVIRLTVEDVTSYPVGVVLMYLDLFSYSYDLAGAVVLADGTVDWIAIGA